jgi:cyanate permease
MQILVVILVGGFAVVDAMSIGLGDVERYSYAAISGVLIASLFIGRRYNRSTRSIRRILQVYMGIVGIGLVMVLLQPTIRWMYVVGDLVSVAMPLIILVLGMRSRDTFFDTRMLRLPYACQTLGVTVPAASSNLPCYWRS